MVRHSRLARCLICPARKFATVPWPCYGMLYYIREFGAATANGSVLMATGDPFQSSVMARSSVVRLGVVSGVIACLWLAILWAVVLP